MKALRPLLLSLLLVAAPGLSPAQTTAPDNSTPAPSAASTTNTPDLGPPASAAPAMPDTAPPASTPGQIVTPGGAEAPPPDIEDIRPPFFYLHSWFWFWVALGVVGAIGLIVLLWLWLKPERWLSPKSAYDLTLEKLEKAKSMLSEENPMPYAVFISETIRSYLSQRFRTPSTRRTTEEFLGLMEKDQATPLAAYRDLLRDFLNACDLVKFGRYQPDLVELEKVQQRAFTFVTATKPSPTPDEYNRSRA